MDALLLSRIQFAITVGFHFLFPPLTIGLAWLLVAVEWKAWRTGEPTWEEMGRLFGKLFALSFAVGVATGILMEFQFGTNWSRYSKYVGDIFGAPLAAEGVFAFFLESTFLGLYLFGRRRVPKGVHWFSMLMVAVGATISAFWIIVANSWQQTPAGHVVRSGRAELVSFWDAVFNPSTLPRYTHTVLASLVAGAFLMAAVGAYRVMRHRSDEIGRRAIRLAVPWGLAVSILVAFPFGHWHAQQVAETQPVKFAALEGLYDSTTGAPLVLFGVVENDPPDLRARIEIPGLLSWMAFGDPNAPIRGISVFPVEDRPPLWTTFVSFHNMVILGLAFIALMAWGTWRLWRGTMFEGRTYLKLLLFAMPLPLLATQFGWVAAEVGRQPWIVYGMLRTQDAWSPSVSGGEVMFSILLFGVIYLFLGTLWVRFMIHEAGHGLPEAGLREELA
jgi:cytochrome d ubiquinol oxidase subunit I